MPELRAGARGNLCNAQEKGFFFILGCLPNIRREKVDGEKKSKRIIFVPGNWQCSRKFSKVRAKKIIEMVHMMQDG